MFGIHPLRWVMRSTTRKLVASVILLSGTGTTGATLLAPDSVPGQLGIQFVRVTEHVVDKIVDQGAEPGRPLRP